MEQIESQHPQPETPPELSGLKIGRLAVNEKYAGNGVGTFILDSIKYAFTTVKRLGCRFLTVDALKSATTFYEKNGFQFFTELDKDDETRLMFYDLKNLAL